MGSRWSRPDAERGVLTDSDWKDVCEAPCDGYVPAFGSYRVSLRSLGFVR